MSTSEKEQGLLKPSDFFRSSLLLPSNMSVEPPNVRLELKQKHLASLQSTSKEKSAQTLAELDRSTDSEVFSNNVTRKHNRSWHDVDDTMQDEMTCHILLSDAKLRENNKILKAYEDGDFPVQRTHESNTRRVSSILNNAPAERPHYERNKISVKVTNESEPCQPKCTYIPLLTNTRGMHNDQRCIHIEKSSSHVLGADNKKAIMDTSNDAAIAAALQDDLNHSSNKRSQDPSVNTSNTSMQLQSLIPSHGNDQEADYYFARTLQEEYDKEMTLSSSYTLINDDRSTCTSHHGFTLIKRGSRSRHQQCEESEISSGYESASGTSSDELSYEVLSQLKDVSKGFTSSEISRYTSLYKYSKTESKPSESCRICFDEFISGQQLRYLPCLHTFHRYCIDKWLFENQTCPVCIKTIKST